jgi:hypothetical protein
MHVVRRLVVLGLAALAVAAVTAGIAHAALWLNFSRASAEPGGIVYVRTAGTGALSGARKRPVRIFLADAAVAAQIRSTRDRRLAALGRLRVDRKGTGRLRFATPNLPPGEYTTLMHCPDCARYSNGRTLFQSGPSRPFTIKPALRDCDSSVYGELPPGWERNSVRAGPFWLVGLRGYGPSAFRPVPGKAGHYRPVKVVLTLDNGVAATLSVPTQTRGLVGIHYDSDSPFWNARSLRVRNARYAMTFEGCPSSGAPHTQFNGSFVVAGPRCAQLEIAVRGRPEPISVAIPFGAAC